MEKKVFVMGGFVSQMRIEDVMQATSLGTQLIGIEVKRGEESLGEIFLRDGTIVDVRSNSHLLPSSRMELLKSYLSEAVEKYEVYRYPKRTLVAEPLGSVREVLLRIYSLDEREETTAVTPLPASVAKEAVPLTVNEEVQLVPHEVHSSQSETRAPIQVGGHHLSLPSDFRGPSLDISPGNVRRKFLDFSEAWRGMRLVLILGAIAGGASLHIFSTLTGVKDLSLVSFGVGLYTLLRK